MRELPYPSAGRSNMPDLKAVPFDPKKKVRSRCRCTAAAGQNGGSRKNRCSAGSGNAGSTSAETAKPSGRTPAGHQPTGSSRPKDNAYNLKLCLRWRSTSTKCWQRIKDFTLWRYRNRQDVRSGLYCKPSPEPAGPGGDDLVWKSLETMQGFSEDDSALIARLNRAKSAIIDDLGAETKYRLCTGKGLRHCGQPVQSQTPHHPHHEPGA